jgi:2-haloalkanoic acid dehalogenase type II
MRFRCVFTPASPPNSGDFVRAASHVVSILARGSRMAIRGLVFDAYGTLYDVQSVRTKAVELCGEKGELVTQLWRLKQLEYTWLRALMAHYEDFWSVTRASLEFSLESVGLSPSPSLCEPLMQKYLNLDLYPEAREALSSLKDHKLAILSNGSPRMLQALTQASGIAHLLADVISVDLAKTYKPNAAVYALVSGTACSSRCANCLSADIGVPLCSIPTAPPCRPRCWSKRRNFSHNPAITPCSALPSTEATTSSASSRRIRACSRISRGAPAGSQRRRSIGRASWGWTYMCLHRGTTSTTPTRSACCTENLLAGHSIPRSNLTVPLIRRS